MTQSLKSPSELDSLLQTTMNPKITITLITSSLEITAAIKIIRLAQILITVKTGTTDTQETEL